MGKLHDRMLENMRLRNLKPKTIKAYLWHMRQFTRYFDTSPDLLGEEHVRKYLLYLRDEKRCSVSGINQARCALKFFFVNTLGWDWHVHKIPTPKTGRRLPVVLARVEVRSLLSVIGNLKHRVILMTIYSGGLRLNEGTHLKLVDIDSKRMQIRVDQGKGEKDRYTLLSRKTLEALREYWRCYRPDIWLFPGKDKARPINGCTVQRAFQRAKKKSRFRSRPVFTPYGIALPPICSKMASTFSPSRSSLAIPA